jgi:hypothetical protein
MAATQSNDDVDVNNGLCCVSVLVFICFSFLESPKQQSPRKRVQIVDSDDSDDNDTNMQQSSGGNKQIVDDDDDEV